MCCILSSICFFQHTYAAGKNKQTQRAKGFSTNQWDILYDADPSLCCKQNEKICICCVTAKNVSESDLDISLLSLILNNCCNLTPNEKIAVQSLRDMKNNYISHPTNMSLSNSDFQSLWCQVEHNIKHLDSTKTYLYQQQILLHRPMDVSLVQKYFNNCFDASAQLDSKMKNLHAFIAGGEKRVIEAINDNYSQVNRKQEHILKYLQKLQSTKEYKQSESNNVGDCIRTKRKRHDPAVWLDVSDEENINADTYVSKKRKQQKLERFNLLKGHTDDLRYKQPDTKPLDESKEYISSNLIGSKLPTAVSLQMDYKVCTMKDLTKQQGFKKANKFICGECDWLTISLYEFLKHGQQCEMRQKENKHVKIEYKKYVVARITVPSKDKDLSSKIEKEWQQGNINPQQSSIEVNYITTGCVVIWVKVELLLFLNISKFYSALDNLLNDIFQKYEVNLPLYSVEVYDIATGYVDNLTDKLSCGDCMLTCNTLDSFISHKKTRCFKHVLPEEPVSSASFLSGWIPQNSGWEKIGSSPLTDDSFTVNNRCANFVESLLAKDSGQKDSSTCVEVTDINCGLSHASGDFSGKDSAVVSEVEFEMSSECSDSDVDMIRKNIHRLKSRDISYSSGTSVSPINRKSESPPNITEISSFDASSEDSDGGAGEFSTETEDQDSGLELDFNSDASSSPTTLHRFHVISKCKGQNQRKDGPWNVIQFSDDSDKEVVTFSESKTSINTWQYEISKQFGSSTLPKWGVKRELYNTTLRREETFTLTEEEANYVRMSFLLTVITPRAVRTLFDREFAPECLEDSLEKEYHHLSDLKREHRINESQWNLLFPRFPDVPDSKTFDVTLMITLLRNLTPMAPPSCGFDRLPAAMETTPVADLARIQYYRNFLAHIHDGKIGVAFLNMACNDITSAIDRLGGQQMKQECDHMKTKTLDSTIQEIMMDIKCSNSEIMDTEESFEWTLLSCIQMKHYIYHQQLWNKAMEIKTSQNDTVPWNIRGKQFVLSDLGYN
ncbi:unnamed protein product [Mytilus edulis]|uniref:DZIP3-like HEPN domain-containing protein n=1 Tax=Mytilus edulis TaxID=6550 RepID=A0A8S3VFR9_MYTED|nr:unnamed protein product [Mytilus edulis]